LRLTARQADLSGQGDRALAYARQALAAIDPDTDPVQAGLVHERLGRFMWYQNYPPDEILEHNREAVRLVPAEPATVERATVLATLGQQLMIAARNAEAIEVCCEAIRVAQAASALAVEGHAHNTLGSALSGTGRHEEARAELALAREIALQTESWFDLARAAVNGASNLKAANEYEEALATALEGAEQARRRGLDRASGAFLRVNAASSLYELGRWDEAEEQLREADSWDTSAIDRLRGAHAWATLLVGQGRFDEAQRMVEQGRALLRGTTPDVLLEFAMVEARIRAWNNDPAGAFELAQLAFEKQAWASTCSDAGPPLLMTAAGAAQEEEHIALVGTKLDEWRAEGRWGGGEPADVPIVRKQLAAELHRDDPAAWREVADDWERCSRVPNAIYARVRQAGAYLAQGDRDAAEATARDAYAISTRVGFVPMSASMETLARTHGLDLGRSIVPETPAEAVGLTAREREVLVLLSEGRTNRQIGEELFISTKTASVHVSNILAKLQVANRGEAAAAARRLGLDAH
jgi:ATP/maltotriose-dependent transcriptional regulator MalT